jgi:hypothetical protein
LAKNIEIDLQDGGWGGMDRVVMVHDRDIWRAFLNAAMNSIKHGEFRDWLSIS